MTKPSGTQSGTGSLGFTLIEVLGAVAVLAILYTVLAGVAIQALRAEGESRRRMEASLLIGEHMAILEAAIALGSAPALGEQTEEIEIFTIETRVRSIEAGALGFDSTEATEGSAEMLFAESENSDPPPLREIEILIRWSEGDRELEIARSTYALDTTGMAGQFPTASDGGSTARSDGEGGSRSSRSERDSGKRRSGPSVNCSDPCPAKDVDCLVRQLSECV